MNLPVRTALAALTLTLFAAPAFAAPVPSFDSSARLVVTVADDATSENDAIQLEQNKMPQPEGSKAGDPSAKTGSDPVAGGADNEAKQLQEEKNN